MSNLKPVLATKAEAASTRAAALTPSTLAGRLDPLGAGKFVKPVPQRRQRGRSYGLLVPQFGHIRSIFSIRSICQPSLPGGKGNRIQVFYHNLVSPR